MASAGTAFLTEANQRALAVVERAPTTGDPTVRTIDLEALHLGAGAHNSWEDGACVMEAAAWMAGEEFSDHPKCVSPVIAAFMRRLNDGLDDEDRQRLKRWIPLVLDTNAGPEVDSELAWMAADWSIRTQTPILLRLAGFDEWADTMAGFGEFNAKSAPSIRPVLEQIGEQARAKRFELRSKFIEEFKAKLAEKKGAAEAAGAAGAAGAAEAAWAAARQAAADAARAAVKARLAPHRAELDANVDELLERMVNRAKAAKAVSA